MSGGPALAGRSALVTGATGFLGSHLVEALRREQVEVRALVRATSNTRALEALGVTLFRGGFSDLDGLRAACRGVDFVVHAAGGGKVESVEAFYADNRDTTQALLDAARASSPELSRFVLVSSAAAHGPGTPGRPALETDPPTPRSHYGKSKLAAEQVVRTAVDALPVSILRPPAVYGPRDTRMLGLFSAVQRGLLPQIGDGETSLVHVADCVQAILRLLEHPHDSGRVYFVSDGEVYSRARIGAALEQAFGRSALRIPVPTAVLHGAARLSEGYARLTGRATFLTRDKVQDLLQPSWVISPQRLRDEVGYEPTIHFEDGARRTAKWYSTAGWLG